jgi:hypothetical protein
MIPPLKKGDLTKFGYHAHNLATQRKQSLIQAMQYYGPLSVFKKVNSLSVLSKNKEPKLHRKYENDKKFIHKYL